MNVPRPGHHTGDRRGVWASHAHAVAQTQTRAVRDAAPCYARDSGVHGRGACRGSWSPPPGPQKQLYLGTSLFYKYDRQLRESNEQTKPNRKARLVKSREGAVPRHLNKHNFHSVILELKTPHQLFLGPAEPRWTRRQLRKHCVCR